MYSTDNGPHMNSLARRRHDAVPQREELELGGRLPGAGDGPLAGPHPGRAGAQRHRQPQRLVRDPARRGRRHRRRRSAQGRHRPGRHDVQGAPRRAQPARLPHRRGAERARASTSSTSPTTATSPRCATTTGSSSSSSSGRQGTLSIWAEPYTELRVPKIFNLRTDPYERADITSNTYYDWMLDHAWTCSSRRRPTWRGCSRPSPSSRPDRSRPASASTRCWRSSRPASRAALTRSRAGPHATRLTCPAACSRWAPTTTTPRRHRSTGCGSAPSPSTRPR